MALEKTKLVIDIEAKSNVSRTLEETQDSLKKTSKTIKTTKVSLAGYNEEVGKNTKGSKENNQVVNKNIEAYQKLGDQLRKNMNINIGEQIFMLNKNIKALNRTLKQTEMITASPDFAKSDGLERLNQNIQKVASVTRETMTLTGGIKNIIADFGAVGTVIGGAIAGMKVKDWIQSGKNLKDAYDGVSATFLKITDSVKNFSTNLKTNAIPTMFKTVEVLSFASPLLVLLGAQMERAENKFVSFTGSVLAMAGLVSGSLMGAISFGITLIGRFVESIGVGMVESMAKLQDKFIEFQSVMDQFTFVVRNYNRELGSDTVGSFELWNNQLEKLIDNTVFSRKEIIKTIQMIVAEGSVLKLVPEQLIEISNVAADIASTTHRPITEVTQLLINGLANTASSLIGLNIDIRNTTLEQSKLLKETGLVVDQLTQQEKVEIRLAGVMKKTAAIRGAAAEATKSVAGQLAMLKKEQDEMAFKIAKTGDLTRMYLEVLIRLQKFLNKMPTPILQFIGRMRDLIGVTLIITGNILKLSGAILAFVLALKALSAIMSVTIGLSFSLAAAFKFLGTRVFPIIAVLGFLLTAFDNLLETNEAFAATLTDIGRSLGFVEEKNTKFNDSVKESENLLIRFLKFIRTVFEQAMIGLAIAVNSASLAFIQLKKLFADKEDIEAYDLMVQHLDARLHNLGRSANYAWDELGIFGGTAMASEAELKKLNKQLEKGQKFLEAFRKRVRKNADEIYSYFDETAERVIILGDEFEKAQAMIIKAQNEINAAFKRGGSETEIANRLANARIKKLQEEIRLDRIRNDIFKGAQQNIISLRGEELRLSGRITQAIKIEFKEKIDGIKKYIDGLKSVNRLDRSVEMALTKQIVLLKKVRDLRIKQSEVKEQRGDPILAIRHELNRLLSEELKLQKKFLRAQELDNKSRMDAFNMRIDQIKKTTKLTTDELKIINDAAKALKRLNASALDRVRLKIKEDELKLLNEITETNKDLYKTIVNLGLTREDQINRDYQQQLDLLAVKQEQLRAEQKLTDQVQEQINKQAKLLEQNRELAKLQSKRGRGRVDVAMVVDSFVNLFQDEATQAFTQMAIEGADTFIGKILGADITPIVEGFKGVFSTGATIFEKVVKKIFSAEFITDIADTLKGFVDLPEKIIEAMGKLGEAIDGMIEKLPMAIKKLVSEFPKLIRGIMEKIPALIDVIFDALEQLVEAMPSIVDSLIEKLPTILEKILQRLPSLITKIFEAIPIIVRSIVQQLPTIMKILANEFPKIVSAIVEGFLGAAGEIVAVLIDELITKGGIVKIAVAFIKGLVKSVGAFVSAFVKGIAKALSSIFGGFKFDIPAIQQLEDLPDKLSTGLKKIASEVTGATSQIFKVGEVEGQKRAQEQSKMITEAIEKGFDNGLEGFIGGMKAWWTWIEEAWKKLWNWGVDLWRKFWDGVVEVWRQLWANIKSALDKFGEILGKALAFVSEVLNKLGEWIKKLFDWLVELGSQIVEFGKTIINSIWEGAKGLWNGFVEILKSVGDTFSEYGKKIWQAFSDGLNTLGDWFKDRGNEIWKGLQSGLNSLGDWFKDRGNEIWKGLQGGLNSLGDWFKDRGKEIWEGFKSVFNIGSLSGGGGGGGGGGITAADILTGGLSRFANGGIIPGNASIPGDSILNDKILAFLSPGEAVIPRSLMENTMFGKLVEAILNNRLNIPSFANGGIVARGPELNLSNLGFGQRSSMVNRTPVTQNFNFNVTIETNSVDEEFMKDRFMTEVKESLRRDSLDGKRLIEITGIGA